MRILILNWRDIRNPAAGGAEILTHEIAKRLVRKGLSVTQISSGYLGSKKEELLDGVKIIRLGKWWSVHILAFFYYIFKLRSKIDIIIDEVHWFPYFAVLYAPKKTVLLSCEVANKLFFQIFPYPLAVLGRFIEKIYLRLYKNIAALVISPSTKEDLLQEGFKGENITILPMGLTVPSNIKIYAKEKKPTIIYLSRLCKQKGIEDALEAFQLIKKEIPTSRLWLVGKGKYAYVEKLKKRAKEILPTDIIFFGFVSEKRKFELLSKAHILIVPSIHEGWGLIVPEAGYVGTPAVVYNVSGLKDIVEDGKDGFKVDENPSEMAEAAIRILKDNKKYDFMQRKAIEKAKSYNWDKTAKTAFSVIVKYANRKS